MVFLSASTVAARRTQKKMSNLKSKSSFYCRIQLGIVEIVVGLPFIAHNYYCYYPKKELFNKFSLNYLNMALFRKLVHN